MKPLIKTWRQTLLEHAPLLLPSVYDAMTARLAEAAGFPACQVGVFALCGARWGFPDVDLVHYYEVCEAVGQITQGLGIPVMVDCDDGYGDVKNVTRTVRGYEDAGVAAVFLEDQQAPKKCGHMGGKRVIPVEDMVRKVRAALAAREGDLFVVARTDAGEPEGLEGVLRRGEAYLGAGADALYVDGLTDLDDLEEVGKAFSPAPLALSIMEGGGKTPWVDPSDLHEMGYGMVLYPTTLLFSVHRAAREALARLKGGEEMEEGDTLGEFEKTMDLDYWASLEGS